MRIRHFFAKGANRTYVPTLTWPTDPADWTPQDESDIPDNLRLRPTYVDPWANDPDRTTRRESGI